MFLLLYSQREAEVEHMCVLMHTRTMVEVELCYGQQDSGKRQVRAETTEQGLHTGKGSVDQ